MDLFKTMQDFKITPDEAWTAVSYFGSLGHEAGLLTPGLGIEHFIDFLQDAADAKAGLKGGTPRTIEGPFTSQALLFPMAMLASMTVPTKPMF